MGTSKRVTWQGRDSSDTPGVFEGLLDMDVKY